MTQLPTTSHDRSKSSWIRWFRIAVATSVVLAIAYTGFKTAGQLQASNFHFGDVSWAWCVAAIAVYVVAMLLSWMFWHRVLVALGQQAPPMRTMLAFFASQLGKYVPGKAMVVIIRIDMIRGVGKSVLTTTGRPCDSTIQTGPAAASVFVETLTWLFVGSAMGSALIMVHFREQTFLLVAAAFVTIVVGSLTAPPVFRTIAKRFAAFKIVNKAGTHPDAIGQAKKLDQALAGLNWSTMGFGWLVMSLGWCLNGLSLWLVLHALGAAELALQDFPLALTCVCLATVAGFVSLLPGGIGVRELVMIPLLGARFGSVTAVIAAILIRLVWLAAELLTSAIIYLWLRFTGP